MSFGTAEYQERIQKTKERMASKGIEVLLITDPANMNYLSGYDGWSFYVHQMLIIIDDEDQPIWVGRTMDANAAKITTWLYHDNIISYPDTYVQSDVKHPMDFVADILKQIGQDKRCVGVEMENYYFTAKCYEQLKKGLPNASFQDATLLVNWVRIVKSDQEIKYMKQAAIFAEKAMNTGIEMINEDIRECDVAAQILHAQVTGTAEFGGDYPAIMPLMPSGERTSTPHLTWTDARYKNNESVILELAGCYKRYHSPLARTIHIGAPSDELKKLAQVTLEGLEKCLAMIKPGIVLEEICETWTRSIAAHGYEKESRIGYPMGLNYPPDWGEHTASIRKGDRTILQPNMTFHLIPGMWCDKSGFEVSESFRVTETGCEIFADLPRGLFVKSKALIR
ncbi:Xaa-Pro aminopeptidase [Planococcus antarcticus DSM 14505]|uniref:Ectoine hydrolase DoeA n=1 Tax=Planococcus antarcticus DSM 14505 TaxID=1185653 RepID=A0A1C7DKI4_9BACL|nr:M24 family metallopeptidase [Planococcus antarcticus]ANU11781.1 ectoine hydrolase DoeA [Planococcus antarcticus DSM 14505]EIM06361.1 Xaa-Pro aminopeptidase [Planococcus antarcticus DSM 14505]